MEWIQKSLPSIPANHQGTTLKITGLQGLEVEQATGRRVGIEKHLKSPVKTVSLRGDLRGNPPSRLISGFQQEPINTSFLQACCRSQSGKAGSNDNYHEDFYTVTGSRCQISEAYSAMVRSLENLPIRAVLRIAISAHRDLSWNAALTLS